MKTIQVNSLLVRAVELAIQQRDAKHDWRYIPGLLLYFSIEGNDYEDGFPTQDKMLFLKEGTAKTLITLLQQQLAKIEEGRLSVGAGI